MMTVSPAAKTGSLVAYLELMRFHRPVGIWLLLWPTLWALWLASGYLPVWPWIVIFTLGTVVMRAAGCVINDIFDYRFDSKVLRTKHRPLASGVLELRQAWVTFGLLCIIGLVFWLQLPRLAQEVAVLALAMSIFYPLCKRFFPCPQLVLGLAWYLGMIMAYATVLGHIPVFAWFVYAAAVVWTLAYDTQYALGDMVDDKKLGLRSSAIWFGRWAIPAIILCQLAFLSMMLYVGIHYTLAWPYYVSLILSLIGFGYQYYLTKTQQFLRAFTHNQWVGLLIFLGVLVSL